jgi:hypothetical protein
MIGACGTYGGFESCINGLEGKPEREIPLTVPISCIPGYRRAFLWLYFMMGVILKVLLA